MTQPIKLLRAPTLSRSLVLERTWPFFLDLSVAACGLALFYAVLRVAEYWLGHPVPAGAISPSAKMLPVYAFYSIVRIFVAYVLSLIFAVGYGYVAAYNPRAEPFMIAALDILQSIPVLSFLPAVMLAMISLIPGHQLGVELGAILLIFTGQVWNMAFSFYSSLKSLPRELREASRVFRFSAWQRFWQLELPYAAIGLVWNSMVSVAGGWFFLMACEMFVLGDRDFRLPGLGSFLQTAAGNGNTRAVLWGLAAMIGVIVLMDQLIWRPVIVWADKFKFEQVDSASQTPNTLLRLLGRASFVIRIYRAFVRPFANRLIQNAAVGAQRATATFTAPKQDRTRKVLFVILGGVILVGLGFAVFHAGRELSDLHRADYFHLLRSAGLTFVRVNAALLIGALWTVPVGVAIGSNAKLARIAQPLAQLAASIPATALFPVILFFLIHLRGGLEIAGLALMLLGTQWYILFNVIAW